MGIHLDNNKEDYPIWTDTSTGELSTSLAWNNIGIKWGSTLWLKAYGTRTSLFGWLFYLEAIHNRLPTDERVTKKFRIISPGCHYCTSEDSNTDIENVDHLFCLVLHCKKIWKLQGRWELDICITLSRWYYSVGGIWRLKTSLQLSYLKLHPNHLLGTLQN